MEIKPDEISSILRQRIEGLDTGSADLAEVGTVLSVADGIARVHGFDNVMALEMLDLPHGVTGLALNLEEDNVGAVLFGEWDKIVEGDTIKRTGRLLRSKVITGTPEHTVVGHERMDCDACHSRTVAQCYGCHTTYDMTRTAWDFVREENTPGAFSETEDYRALYPFPLALDQRGRIAPATPGELLGTAELPEVPLFVSDKALYFARTDEAGNVFIARAGYTISPAR